MSHSSLLTAMSAKRAAITDRREEGEGGFTLIELLVVVVIIGILVAIAIPLYLNFENGAKTSSAQSDVNALVNTIKLCQSDNGGTLPAAIAVTGQTVSFTNGTSAICTSDTFTLSANNSATYSNTSGSYVVAVKNSSSGKTATFTSATGQTTTG